MLGGEFEATDPLHGVFVPAIRVSAEFLQRSVEEGVGLGIAEREAGAPGQKWPLHVIGEGIDPALSQDQRYGAGREAPNGEHQIPIVAGQQGMGVVDQRLGFAKATGLCRKGLGERPTTRQSRSGCRSRTR